MIVINSNFLSAMHDFRDNEVFCTPDVTSSSVLRQGEFRRFLMTDSDRVINHNFLIAFRSNFLSTMHGFRDNEVFLQAGHDFIMISPPGGASRNFS